MKLGHWMTVLPLVAGASSVGAQPAAPPAVGGWSQLSGVRDDGAAPVGSLLSDADGLPVEGLHAEGLHLEVAWRQRLGSGYSGVAIRDNTLVTLYQEGVQDLAVAFDRATGDELWRYVIGPASQVHDGAHAGPLSTPAVTSDRVFGLSPAGRLFALNRQDGALVWAIDLVAEHRARRPSFGFATSPLVVEDVLVVALGAVEAAVAGFDPADGRRLWAVASGPVSYQSPVVVDDGSAVAVATDREVVVLKPGSGAVLWRRALPIAPAATLVAIGPGRLFVPLTGGGATLLVTDPTKSTAKVDEAWRVTDLDLGYSPAVAFDGHLYVFAAGVLGCLDGGSGRWRWRSRAVEDGFPIRVGRHLVLLSKSGRLRIAEASPDGYREVAYLKRALFETTWTPPSFADGSVYARSLGQIARYDLAAGAVPSSERAKPIGETILAESAFARLLAELPTVDDKPRRVDSFLAATSGFPIVDTRGLVHFVYRGAADDVAIVGDFVGAPSGAPMRRVEGTDLHYYSAIFEDDARVSYAFVVDHRLQPDPLNPRRATVEWYESEVCELERAAGAKEMSWLAMPEWAAQEDQASVVGGRLETTSLVSARLGRAIELQLYLPAEYDETETCYPLALVHGGGAALAAGGWQDTLDRAIASGRTAPLVAAFFDLDPELGATYVPVVNQEIAPFVATRWRIDGRPSQRAHVGVGPAGAMALSSGLAEDSGAQMVGALSPFLSPRVVAALQPALDRVSARASDRPTVYLGWGEYEIGDPLRGWNPLDANREFERTLRRAGMVILGGEAHHGVGWPNWRSRTTALLGALFSTKAVPGHDGRSVPNTKSPPPADRDGRVGCHSEETR